MDQQTPYTGMQVAALFNVGPTTVVRWARSGKIPSFLTPGGTRRYPSAAIDAQYGHAAGRLRI